MLQNVYKVKLNICICIILMKLGKKKKLINKSQCIHFWFHMTEQMTQYILVFKNRNLEILQNVYKVKFNICIILI